MHTNIFDYSFLVLTQLVNVIIPLLSIYVIFDLLGGLIFGKK